MARESQGHTLSAHALRTQGKNIVGPQLESNLIFLSKSNVYFFCIKLIILKECASPINVLLCILKIH